MVVLPDEPLRMYQTATHEEAQTAGLAMLRPGVGWFRVAYWSEEENRGMAYKGRIQKSGAIQIGSASPVSIADQEVAGRRKHHETRRRGLV